MEDEILNPLTKSTFGFTLYEWRLSVMMQDHEEKTFNVYRIIAKDKMQAVEILGAALNVWQTKGEFKEAFGEFTDDDLDIEDFRPYWKENEDEYWSLVQIAPGYDGVIIDTETCPSYSIIDHFTMQLGEPTKYEDWQVIYEYED